MELTIDQALEQGVTAHKEGKLQDAERFYRAILQAQPNHPDANHNLGVLAVSVGRPLDAIPLFKLALAANPKIEQFWQSYADVLIKLERIDEVKQVLTNAGDMGVRGEKLDRLAIQTSHRGAPGSAPRSQQITILLDHYRAGKFVEVEALANRLTQDFPHYHFGWKILGAALKQLNKVDESLLCMRKSVELSPRDAEAHNNLGVTLRELGRLDAAESSLRRAILINSSFAEAHNNLGNVLIGMGKLEDAGISLSRAVELKPKYGEAHKNLGIGLRAQGRLNEAENSYKTAIDLISDDAEAHCGLGAVLHDLGRLDEAEASYRQALALKPSYAVAHSNLGVVFRELGRLSESEASYKKAIMAEPQYMDAHSNLLLLISSMCFGAAYYLESAKNFSIAVDKLVAFRFCEWFYNRNSESLRIGFVSGDFRSHPVSYFLEGLLMQLQSSSIEVFAYPTISFEDQVTARLRPLFDSWRPLVGLSDEAAAKLIHTDALHILIDLSGHTAKNRLPIFAWKPAPIQISWLGYFASTGLREMDYILGDPFVTPHEEIDHFVEKIWQLPESYLCFTPPCTELQVAPLPALSNGFVTFGCFNSLSRMTVKVASVRAAILLAIPGSKLFLKDKQLDHEAGRNRVLSLFSALGIGPDRLMLEGRSSREEYLACYSRVDLALSPFPYGGGTTSVEGLWMGVPVITMKGDHFLSHLGESIARNAGLSDWVAADEDEYIAKAVAYASDLSALSAIRKGIRRQILKTSLFDAPRFTRHFEQALRKIRSKLG